jgi:hypothetical protein
MTAASAQDAACCKVASFPPKNPHQQQTSHALTSPEALQEHGDVAEPAACHAKEHYNNINDQLP